MSERLDIVRRGFEAIRREDLDTVAGLLAPDVHWHGAGDDQGGCRNREETLAFMRQGLANGASPQLLELREVGDFVVAVLRRRSGPDGELPQPHGELLSVRDGQVSAMVVYPTAEDAFAAADAAGA